MDALFQKEELRSIEVEIRKDTPCISVTRVTEYGRSTMLFQIGDYVG